MKQTENASQLRQRLRKLGLSDPAINAAWPSWWSDDADASSSARTELRFSLARKLGMDPHTLLDEDSEPRFVWRTEARFKHLAGESELERAALTSFGIALGNLLVSATDRGIGIAGMEAASLRESILASQAYVGLPDLLSLCWSIGIPVVHLRVFPLTRKRMAAMAVRVGDRSAILLGKDYQYPPHLAFYLAHELGHIASGQLTQERVFVDLGDAELPSPDNDPEEVGADRFALELLTGNPQPIVLPGLSKYNPTQLAQSALDASKQLRIEPGTLALCFGYSTGDWRTAHAAIHRIYLSPQAAWIGINKVALSQLKTERIPDDAISYVQSVLGTPDLE